MITLNFQPAFAKNLVLAQASADFKTFLKAGLAVKEALQTDVLEKGDSNTRNRKTYSNNNPNLYAIDPANSTSNQNRSKPVNQILTQSNSQPSKQPCTLTKFSIPIHSILERLI
ncbi:hypothetical protein RHMOL_Rhmol04G0226100 [Rhododendron molle]|uniref:Uncharacterized protein n=1 Tax=Rhododendron molle TaxID=49168 RepID=A0ACC0P336_RHOML|nr:hypothetical protein RHMOL_Rhmol04G0226100 [Rhododendron molle]